ncbi:MAG: hypothetical protein NT150_15840 [Bacteroidetes bacterium]|nr:hypothetical protein [Bacteroidota bacterium]
MTNQKFSWKSLFVNDQKENESSAKEIQDIKVEVKTPSVTTFPVSNSSNSGSNNFTVRNEVLNSILEMYERGFDSLNQQGYDFYEFFKAVMATDPHNPQSYAMAYTMASSFDKNVTKASLLSSADFYIKEIQKVHVKYDGEGKKIKSDLQLAQKTEKEKLQREVTELENRIRSLQLELEQKSGILQNFDQGNTGKIEEIDQKIMANNLSKESIIQKITHVVNGINNYI